MANLALHPSVLRHATHWIETYWRIYDLKISTPQTSREKQEMRRRLRENYRKWLTSLNDCYKYIYINPQLQRQ